MDFIDQIRAIAARVPKQKDLCATEEAAKNAFVMPFINALGYNVFDPSEVVPEFTADVGMKKGEKVDYAILHNGEPVILFECKKVAIDLSTTEHSQLFRYFSVTSARIGVLTNGVVYRFYTDLEEKNKLDEKPFLELDLEDVQEAVVEELKRLTKSQFDLETVIDAAEDLKYSKAIKHLLREQLTNPSDEFVRFFAGEVHSGRRLTQAVMMTFRRLVKDALNEFISRQVDNRLKSALAPGPRSEEEEEDVDQEDDSDKIETTEEEIEGYHIVKSIIREVVDASRVSMRDGQSYCAILLDDNNRKPICRLRFNNPERLWLGLIDGKKKEEKVRIESPDDIYQHADKLRAVVKVYGAKSQRLKAEKDEEASD